MHPARFAILASACCCFVLYATAEGDVLPADENVSLRLVSGAVPSESEESTGATLSREKRTLLLKKKLIGAGLLGFGLGVAKGYKAGYYTAPQVHHVYLSPPPAPVKYVEYVEKPVFVERIIERPAAVFKPIHKDPSPYGGW